MNERSPIERLREINEALIIENAKLTDTYYNRPNFGDKTEYDNEVARSRDLIQRLQEIAQKISNEVFAGKKILWVESGWLVDENAPPVWVTNSEGAQVVVSANVIPKNLANYLNEGRFHGVIVHIPTSNNISLICKRLDIILDAARSNPSIKICFLTGNYPQLENDITDRMSDLEKEGVKIVQKGGSSYVLESFLHLGEMFGN